MGIGIISARFSTLLLALLLLVSCAGAPEAVQPTPPQTSTPRQPPVAAQATPRPRATLRPRATPIPTPDLRHFPETGHTIRGALRDFWEQGGQTIFGLPLTEALPINGATVQYFERARFELQPDGSVRSARLVGEEALASMAGGSLLRDARPAPSDLRAMIIGQTAAVRPLERATIHLRIPGYSGPVELVIADRRGPTGRYPADVRDGSAEVEVDALGSLGSQAAIALRDNQVLAVHTSALALRAETSISTGQPRFDEMLPRVKQFMDQDISRYVFDGRRVKGYRSPDSDLLWLRDHVHQGKGYAYWETDMTSLLDQFRRFQYPEGYFDDYIANKPWGVVRTRYDVEADVEYLFIEGVYRAWQATGDDAWMRRQVAAMERGLRYIQTNPMRWDPQHQLVKRPFTVDTWDFEYGPPTVAPDGKLGPRHWFDADTKWSIFHGDNTGYAHSMELLARMYTALGNADRAVHWRGEGQGISERLNELAWNGDFFRHMVHLTPVEVPGVDESRQLSLSNAYALNRSGVDEFQARRIIAEYHRRYLNRGTHFSEWYSIDPPFPAGSLSTGAGAGLNPGEYVNGGLMPLVGGELARGAFQHDAEAYGFDILQRYYSLIAGTGGSYLWYYPIGNPGISGPETLATDGWGSSAMLAALIEGAAGVTDDAKLFERATIAPRWTASDVQHATVVIRYGASNGYVAYEWRRGQADLFLRWTGSGEHTRLRLLLPPEADSEPQATLNGEHIEATVTTSGASRYLEVAAPASGIVSVNW